MFSVVAKHFLILLLVNTVLCDDCTPYSKLVRNNLKDIASNYLISIDESITEEKYSDFYKKPETQFFKENFGAVSSASQFVKLSLTLSYSDAPVKGTDENLLRQSMQKDIENEEMDKGAKKLGMLLLLRNKVFRKPELGVTDRCLTSKNKISVLATMTEELEKLREEVGDMIFENFLGLFASSDENNDFVNDNYFNILYSNFEAPGQRKKRDIEEKLVSNKDNVVIRNQEFDIQENMSMTFNVDSTIGKVAVEASKKCGGLQLFATNETHGKPLTWLDDKLELKIPVHKRFGEWKLKSLNPVRKGCQVKVVGQSTMGFFHTSIAPRNFPGAFKVMYSKPTVNTDMGALLDFYGLTRSNTTYKAQTVRFLNIYGDDIVDPITLDIPAGDEGTVSMKLPKITSSFRLMVEGTNNKGIKFMRMDPRLIEISNLKIEYDSDLLKAKPGKRIRIPVNVTNYGETDIIKLDSWDELDYATVEPSQKRILTNQTKKFHLILNAPEEAVIGLTSKTVVIGRRRRSTTASQVSPSTSVVTSELKLLKINSVHVTAKINSRFSETTVKTSVTNNDDKSREAEIDLLIPMDAFVMKFTMEVGGKIIEGKVEEKKKAKKIFDKAKQSNKTVGKVASRQKSERDFKQSMVAAPGETIIFTVVYQALLYRFDSAYNYKVMLNPNQPINNLAIDVFIVEEAPLKYVKTPGFSDDMDSIFDPKSVPDEPPKSSKITFSNDRRTCHVRYQPTMEEQTYKDAFGLNGAYTVLYDVEGTDMYGSMSVNNGYFTHFFAARTLPTRSKSLIYIMDKSGSMWGTKMEQAKETLIELINLNDENDFFNIILFDSNINTWKDDLVFATPENKAKAIEFVERNAYASGGTNIKMAYSSAFDLFDPYMKETTDGSIELTDREIANYRADFHRLHGQHEQSRSVYSTSTGPKTIRVTFSQEYSVAPELVNVYTKGSSYWPDTFDTEVSNLDGTGFDATITRTENNNPSDGWGQNPYLYFTIKKELNQTFESYLEEMKEIERKRLEKFKKNKEKTSEYWKMICFLTDGQHTSDWTSNDEIADQVRRRNNGRVLIHNVAFGSGADYEFMQQISAENEGIDRRIFENLDAGASIRDFFYEVTNVVMTGVNVEYDKSKVSMLSNVDFPYISKGKEMVISGKLNEFSMDIDQATGAMDTKYNIKGKLSGRGHKDQVIIDFEINPFKTSRISESQHKIEQFSERIWAFMRIKKLLGDLKAMVDDSAEKNETTAEALELSLKYSFVTPLTSIVVLKDKDRKEIEKKLKEDEEKARLAKLTTTTVAPTTVASKQTQAMKTNNQYTQPSTVNPTVYPNYGGVYRDPHVVLPIKPGVNLCFNWNGKDEEVTNLIFHPKSGLIVNAKMTAAPVGIKSENGKDRFYINSVAFVIPQAKANVIVNPYSITIEYFGMDSFSYPVTSKFSISRTGLDIMVYDVIAHGSMSKVHLKIGGIEFKLMLHTKSRVPHVDLAFEDLSHIEGQFQGLVGQFYGKGLTVTESDDRNKAVLRIGKEIADVKRHVMKSNPLTNLEQPCWFAANSGFNLSKHSIFVVDSMTTKPHYTNKDKTPPRENNEIKENNQKISAKAKITVLEALFKKN